ncbi:hypothetical protein [Natrialba sp. INN-245]|nr:hypothetical protein [Natrialba sp. INN-245]
MPARNARDLENGAVLVRQGDLAQFLDCDVETGPESPADDYLFER